MNQSIYLHPNFLRDEAEYHEAERLWNQRWTEIVIKANQREQWETPWINTNFADGTPLMDGNPLFSAVCHARRLGIRVIQLEPTGNPRELDVWTDRFATGEAEEIDELVLSCVLTNETLFACLDMMNQWITTATVQQVR